MANEAVERDLLTLSEQVVEHAPLGSEPWQAFRRIEAIIRASLTADEGVVAELKSMADALRNGGFLKLHAGALPYLDAAIAALQKEPPHE